MKKINEEIKKQIMEMVQYIYDEEDDWGDWSYGVKIDDYKYNIGDIPKNSMNTLSEHTGNPDDDYMLDGVCTTGISPRSNNNDAEFEMVAGYWGKYITLIVGTNSYSGNDPYESVIKNGTVRAQFEI